MIICMSYSSILSYPGAWPIDELKSVFCYDVKVAIILVSLTVLSSVFILFALVVSLIVGTISLSFATLRWIVSFAYWWIVWQVLSKVSLGVFSIHHHYFLYVLVKTFDTFIFSKNFSYCNSKFILNTSGGRKFALVEVKFQEFSCPCLHRRCGTLKLSPGLEVLTSSIGVRVRRFFWIVLGGLSGRVSSEVLSHVCVGEGRRSRGGCRAGCRLRCRLMCVWLKVHRCKNVGCVFGRGFADPGGGCRVWGGLMCIWVNVRRSRGSCWAGCRARCRLMCVWVSVRKFFGFLLGGSRFLQCNDANSFLSCLRLLCFIK